MFSLDGGIYAAYPAGGYNGVAPGAHTITSQNAAGCISAAANITIAAAPGAPAAPTTAQVDPTTCAVPTGTITITSPTAGLTFSLDGGAYAAYPAGGYTGVAPGAHTITAQNAGGCISAAANLTIAAAPGAPAAPTTAQVDPTCIVATGTITITSPTAGLTFSLDGGPYTAYPAGGYNGVASGAHTITAQNAGGCISTPANLTLATAQVNLVINNPAPVCSSATTDLTLAAITDGSSPGLTYTYWEDAAATVAVANPAAVAGTGTYYIKATNAGGCFVTKPVNISQLAAPALLITDPPTACTGSTVDLTNNAVTVGSDAGLTLSYWLDPAAQNTLANPNALKASGTYYIKATNAAGCTQIQPVTVTITSNPKLIITNPAAACGGTTIDLTNPAITAGSDPGLAFTYWQDAAATIPVSNPAAVSGAGTYYVKATAQGGCSMILPVAVSYSQPPTAAITGDQTICGNANAQLGINLTGNGPWTVTYSDGTNSYTINNIQTPSYQLTVTPAVTTTYTITSVSDAACVNSNTSAATVTVLPAVAGIMYPDVSTFNNVPVQLSARNLGTGYSYNWAPATGLDFTYIPNPIFNYGFSTQYLITLTSPAGCVTVDTVFVSIKNPNDAGLAPDLLVPKAWTPNNDGVNDILYPITIHIKQINYFRVFDRWGQLMYETNILGQGWNGMFNGRPQVSDVYTWTVEAIGDDNSVIRKTGNSILLR